MIIRPDPKKRRTGGVEYLEKGRKKDRKHARNEIDERDIYFGDYQEFQAATDYLEEKQIREGTDYSNYHHFTVSFTHEEAAKLTREEKIAIAKEVVKFQWAGFLDEELIKIGENHTPKMKSENNIDERYEHIHIMVSNLNRVTGKKVTPRVHNLYADKLFQTYISRKYGLSIPLLDNARTNKVFRNEIISRYKNDTFQLKKENKLELRKTFINDLKSIENKEDFLRYFQENQIDVELTKDKKKYFVTLSDGEKFNIRGKGFEHVENVLFNKNLEVYDDGIFQMDLPTLEANVNELIENRTVEFEKRLRTQREKARVNSLSNHQNNLESGERPNVRIEKSIDPRKRDNEILYEYVDRELSEREFAENTNDMRTLSVRDMAELSSRTEMLLQSNKGLYIRYEDGEQPNNIVRRAKESDGGDNQEKRRREEIIDENDFDLNTIDRELLNGEINKPKIFKKDSLSFLSSKPQIIKRSELENNISLIDNERKEESLKDLTAFIKDNLKAKEVYEYAAKKYNLFPAKYEVLEEENKINCLDYKKPKKYNVVDFYTKELNLPFKEAIFELKTIHNENNLSQEELFEDLAANEIKLNSIETIKNPKLTQELLKENSKLNEAIKIERAIEQTIAKEPILSDESIIKKERVKIEKYKIEALSSREIRKNDRELKLISQKNQEAVNQLNDIIDRLNTILDERVELINRNKRLEKENLSQEISVKDVQKFLTIKETVHTIKKIGKVEYGALKENNPILKFIKVVKNTFDKAASSIKELITNKRYKEYLKELQLEKEREEIKAKEKSEKMKKDVIINDDAKKQREEIIEEKNNQNPTVQQTTKSKNPSRGGRM